MCNWWSHGTNAITGVFGAYVDSIPMFVVTGQAKRETTVWSTNLPLRQLGDQEVNITSTVSTMTKYAKMITDPMSIRKEVEKAWFLMLNGRPVRYGLILSAMLPQHLLKQTI